MVKDEFMKYKAPTNSIPTYKLYDFDASLNYKPLEYYASLSTDEYNKLSTELKSNIEFTKWAYSMDIFGEYEWRWMVKKLTLKHKISNFFVSQVFMWIIVPVIGLLGLGIPFALFLEWFFNLF